MSIFCIGGQQGKSLYLSVVVVVDVLQSENASFILGSGKVREMKLEDAEKEVCRLEEEARRALEENKRYFGDLYRKKKAYLNCKFLFISARLFSFLTPESEMNYRTFQQSKAQRTVT